MEDSYWGFNASLSINEQVPPEQSTTQIKTREPEKEFKPEYQLDRSKLEADTRYDQLRKDMSSRTIELRAQHLAKEFADKVMPMLDEAIATAEEEHARLKEEGASLVSGEKISDRV